MSFTYSAIGDNTPENREHLEKLGYRKWMWDDEDNDIPFISTMPESKKYAAFTQNDVDSFTNDIDCRNNPSLFQAVTAISDDDNDYQYYLWISKGRIGRYKRLYTNFNRISYDFRKATLAELQEHFK